MSLSFIRWKKLSTFSQGKETPTLARSKMVNSGGRALSGLRDAVGPGTGKSWRDPPKWGWEGCEAPSGPDMHTPVSHIGGAVGGRALARLGLALWLGIRGLGLLVSFQEIRQWDVLLFEPLCSPKNPGLPPLWKLDWRGDYIWNRLGHDRQGVVVVSPGLKILSGMERSLLHFLHSNGSHFSRLSRGSSSVWLSAGLFRLREVASCWDAVPSQGLAVQIQI